MAEAQAIVAYRHKGEWISAADTQSKREEATLRRDPSVEAYLPDANPYTVAALRRRREYGRDVPEWVNLDEGQT